ncbi:Hypothetical predicted protein [Octopus vulgaris]|uniref:Uncharacterized protein n=1 Tax=Octopus vulgaris TaxID=6645 RepID=A0AA36ART2_OCTVU|nr:Hypothetical predicted protein [Octopus vulgaris]
MRLEARSGRKISEKDTRLIRKIEQLKEELRELLVELQKRKSEEEHCLILTNVWQAIYEASGCGGDVVAVGDAAAVVVSDAAIHGGVGGNGGCVIGSVVMSTAVIVSAGVKGMSC